MYEISRYVNANTGGTGVLLDVIVNGQASVRRMVVASSMSNYGEGAYECAAAWRRLPPAEVGRATGATGVGGGMPELRTGPQAGCHS